MVAQRSVLSSDEQFVRLVVSDLLVVKKTLDGLGRITRQKSRTKPLDTLLRLSPINSKDFICQLRGIALITVLLFTD